MPIPELSRRAFLSRSLTVAGAVAVLPGLTLACAREDLERAPRDLRVLDAGQWALLDAIAEAFVPAGGAFEAGARSVDVAGRADAFLADERPRVVSGLHTALLVVEWASPLAAGRLPPFSGLGTDARAPCLDALRTSRLGPLRETYAGLKQLCVFAFYATDAVWPALGYDGPWVGRSGR